MEPRPPFGKILIANRGEIALRVQRTCRDLGIQTVAVYSDPDRNALHVRYAHAAYALGGAAPRDSYLRADKILDIARRSGAQAVHPGFGFLAENAEFARAVADAGLVFIGPPAPAMRAMGDKLEARAHMLAAGVPVVPGTSAPVAGAADAARAAAAMGYPVMLKAAAGGGGKGIRIVRRAAEMDSAFATAAGESASAFGDGRLYLEKFLERPRHVEIQVLADAGGRVLHLGERECSIQRRHQKLIEEAPAAWLDADTRTRMGAAAVAAARAVGYRSAGTVEFLWSDGRFYFLEMNTRLQVEHAITEEIYGVDLVEQMIRVAAGEPLGLPEDLAPQGHAIEVRLNAEDPDRGFAPSLGRLRNLRLPGGPGVRIDSAAYSGMEVTPYYDSMLGKLITWGPDRELARRRMLRALAELHVGGVVTSAGVALRALRSGEFRRADYDTGTLERLLQAPREHPPDLPDDLETVAAIAAALHRQHVAVRGVPPATAAGASPWVSLGRRRAFDQRAPRGA